MKLMLVKCPAFRFLRNKNEVEMTKRKMAGENSDWRPKCSVYIDAVLNVDRESM
jgi:hypothetical protein